MKEESAVRLPGPGPAAVLRFGVDEEDELALAEHARFSADRDWMPNVVLIAKSTYVWLDRYPHTQCFLNLEKL